MAPLIEKNLKIPERVEAPKWEDVGKLRPLPDVRTLEASSEFTERAPLIEQEMKILPELKTGKSSLSYFKLSSYPSSPKTLRSPTSWSQSTFILLSAVGLGTFFFEPQVLSWITNHLSSVLGMIGLPILGMVMGGGKKEGAPPDGIERFQDLTKFVEAAQAMENDEGPLRTLSFVGDSEAGYVDRIYSGGTLSRGYEKLKLELSTEVYSFEMDNEKADRLGRWTIGAPSPEQAAGYEFSAFDGRGESHTLNIVTKDRKSVEIIHLQVLQEIERTGSVNAAFDWLVNRSPWNSDLFEISQRTRSQWAALVPFELKGMFAFSELRRDESIPPLATPLFQISATSFDDPLVTHTQNPGEGWTFFESRDLGNGQYEVSFSRFLELNKDFNRTVFLSEDKARLLGVLPGSDPQRIYRMKILAPPNPYQIEAVINRSLLTLGMASPGSLYAGLEDVRDLGNGLYEVTFLRNKIVSSPRSSKGYTSFREELTLFVTREEAIKFNLLSRIRPSVVYRLTSTKKGEGRESLPALQEFPESINDPLFTRGTVTLKNRTVTIDVSTAAIPNEKAPDRIGAFVLVARENGKKYKLTIQTTDFSVAESIHRRFVEKWREVGSARYALDWTVFANWLDRELFLSWEISI